MTDEGRVLIDTNILTYATLENDPRSERSRELLLAKGEQDRFTSVQNLAEMYPNLTGPKMERPDAPAVARAKIQSIASRWSCARNTASRGSAITTHRSRPRWSSMEYGPFLQRMTATSGA